MDSLSRVRPSVCPSVRFHYRVRSKNPIPVEGFSSNLAEMFTSTRGCACVSSRSHYKVKYKIIKYQTLCRVRSVRPTLIERFSLILSQMFTSTRGCAEPMLPFCRLKVKVTLEGQKMTQKIFLNFNMYLNISETRKPICLKFKIYMKCHNQDKQVKFHNSVLHFVKVMPFLSLQFYIQSNIRQYVVYTINLLLITQHHVLTNLVHKGKKG